MPWLELVMRVISSFLSKDKNKKMLEYAIDIAEHKGTKALQKLLKTYREQKGTKLDVNPNDLAENIVKNANTHDLTKITMAAIDKELKDVGVSPGMRKRAQFDMNANSKSAWWKREISKHKYAWRYLIDEKHSDRCIYKMRNKYIGKTFSTIQVQFERHASVLDMDIPEYLKKQLWVLPNYDEIATELSKVYDYKKVPNAIIVVMTIIPLTYLTKNNYFAGAWNFFWYSWLYSHLPPGDPIRNALIRNYSLKGDEDTEEAYQSAVKGYRDSWKRKNKPFKKLKTHKVGKIKNIWKGLYFKNVK